jgi:hypothetical protein
VKVKKFKFFAPFFLKIPIFGLTYISNTNAQCSPRVLLFKLSQFQPYNRGLWPTDILWFSLVSHSATMGSPVWNRITRAWKAMVQDLYHIPPQSYEE